MSKSNIEVGYERNDGFIHCGNDVYISNTSYQNAKNNAAKHGHSNSHFVKDIAVSIIGIQELKETSISGRICSRTKNQGSKKKESKRKTDPTKLGAVYSLFEYYLKTEKLLTPVEIEDQTREVGAWIAAKMWDLNSPPRKPKQPANNDKKKSKHGNEKNKKNEDKELDENETDDGDTEDDAGIVTDEK